MTDIQPGAFGEAAALTLQRLAEPDAAPLRHVAAPKLVLRASTQR